MARTYRKLLPCSPTKKAGLGGYSKDFILKMKRGHVTKKFGNFDVKKRENRAKRRDINQSVKGLI